MEISTAIHSFADYLKFQKRYSQHSVLAYQTDLGQFGQFMLSQFDIKHPGEVSTGFIRSWLAWLKDEGISSRSINRKISALKSFYKFLLRQEVVSYNPLTALVTPKSGKKLPAFVAEKDIQILFEHVEFPDSWQGKVDRMILVLLYATGMRRSELINLKISQVDFSNKVLRILGKGNKERLIPVSGELVQQLHAFLDERKALGTIEDTAYLLVNDKGKRLNPRLVYARVVHYLGMVSTVERKSPHVLRHTFATHLANSGADLNAIKELLGHSSLAATQVYTHNTIESLKQVFKQAHPKA